MSVIEKAARPYLTPLILGEDVSLDRSALDVVAKWIVLKILVAEHSDPDSAVTPRHFRMAFRDKGTIPDYMRVYLASHDVPFEKSVGYLRNSQAVALRPPDTSDSKAGAAQIASALVKGVPRPSPPLGDVANNIQTLTFFLGRVFVHATATRVDNFWIEDVASIPTLYDTAQIWPPTNSQMSWPREPSFTLRQIESIGQSMTTALKAQKLHWVNTVPAAPNATA